MNLSSNSPSHEQNVERLLLPTLQTLQTLQTGNMEHGTQNMCLFPTLQTLKLSNSSNSSNAEHGTRNAEHVSLPNPSNSQTFKLFKHGTRNIEHGTRNSVLSQFIQIFHFLFIQEFIDTTQVFTNLFISYFVYLGNQAVQELTVM